MNSNQVAADDGKPVQFRRGPATVNRDETAESHWSIPTPGRRGSRTIGSQETDPQAFPSKFRSRERFGVLEGGLEKHLPNLRAAGPPLAAPFFA